MKTYPELEVMIKKIQSFKERNRLTNQDIALALNVSKSHISRILNGETVPSLPFLIELSHYMKQSLGSLFTDDTSDMQTNRVIEERMTAILQIFLAEMGLEPGQRLETIEYIARLKDSRK